MGHAKLRGVVALDGPSGTGKSTVARELATRLGAAYLDTGAMYRAVTLAVLRQCGPESALPEPAEVARLAAVVTVEMGTDPLRPWVALQGQAVDEEIRGARVTAAVSAVSAIREVREVLVAQQRRLIHEVAGGVVVEGRDIGTVVVPEAELKVYLTAEAPTRAERRREQDAAAGREGGLAATRAEVQRRDSQDSGRRVAPLRPAEDAVEVDTTRLSVAEVLERLVTLLDDRGLLIDAERMPR